MNPTRHNQPSDFYDAFDDEYEKELAENQRMNLRKEEILKRMREEQQRKVEAAEAAHRDLCDALGVETLNARVEGDPSRLSIPMASVATIISRLKALESNALAEGVL